MSATTTVHNVTDVATPRLQQYHLVGKHFELMGALVAPGRSMDFPAEVWEAHKSRYVHLIDQGALVVGDLSEAYKKATTHERVE